MSRTLLLGLLFLLLLTGCADGAFSQPAGPTQVARVPGATATGTATRPAMPTATRVPTLTPLPPTRTQTHTPLPPSATPPPTLTATPTVNPYLPYTVAALTGRAYGGGALEIVDTLRDEPDETMARYLFRYPSDGLDIYGFLSVPDEGVKFPVAIVLHGYIPPEEYDVEAYTLRYADALTAAGYFVIHPNLRNYPPSDSGDNAFRVGYAVDVLNLIAIIQEQSHDPTGPLRRADGDQIHLMGHSMGGGVALRVSVIWPNAVRALVLYGSMSGDEILNFERILEWSDGRSGHFELAASAEMHQAIAPIYHLDRLQAPVSIHHSADDTVVPVAWSEALCDRLTAMDRPVMCHIYQGVPHTFRGGADDLFMTRMIAFFDRY